MTCQNKYQWSETTVTCERMEKEDVLVDVYVYNTIIYTQVLCVQHSPTLLMDK